MLGVPKQFLCPLFALVLLAALIGFTDIVAYRNLIANTIQQHQSNAALGSHGSNNVRHNELETKNEQATNELALAASESAAANFQPKKLHVLTLADNPRMEICLTATSTFLSGSILQVLAWDHSTHFFDQTSCGAQCEANENGDFRVGQQKKVHWLTNYFEKYGGLDDDDLVLFTDAWDVVIQRNLNQVAKSFLKLTNNKRGVILNGEPNCGDSFTLPGEYGDQLREATFSVHLNSTQPAQRVKGDKVCDLMAVKTNMTSNTNGPNWSLGSGGIIGDVRSVRAYLRRVNQVHDEQQQKFDQKKSPFQFYGDQISFQLAYVGFPEINVMVDRSAEIFFVTNDSTSPNDLENFNVADGCLANYYKNEIPSRLSWTNSTPFIIHFPGGHKPKYSNCARIIESAIKDQSRGKYFFDIDRQRMVLISSICPHYS